MYANVLLIMVIFCKYEGTCSANETVYYSKVRTLLKINGTVLYVNIVVFMYF
jgi:hypothetical protein